MPTGGRGHGAAVMHALEQLSRDAYDVGALGSTDEAAPFYEARGWTQWQGPCSALTPQGTRSTPEADGCIYVLAYAVELDVHGELTCDWRDGDVW